MQVSNALASRIEVAGFEDEITVYKDGSLGFGLSLSLVNIDSWSDDDLNSFASLIRTTLNGLPQNIHLQFVLSCDPLGFEIPESHLNMIADQASAQAVKICRERVEKLRADRSRTPEYALQLFVRRPTERLQRLSWNPFAKPSTQATLFEQDILAVKQIRDNLIVSLTTLKLSPQSLTPADITSAMQQLWNPGRIAGDREPSLAHIPDDVLFSDVVVSERGFRIGDIRHRIISLKVLPDCSFVAMAAKMAELPFSSKIFLSIYLPDQVKEIEALQSQRRLAFALVSGRAVRDIDSEAKFGDLETLLESMVAQGEKVFHVGLNILVTAKSDEQIEARANAALALLRDLGGAEGMEESYSSFDMFCTAAIPNAQCLDRYRRMKTSNLADFLPIYGPWTGHQEPSILLRSRSRSVVKLNPFSVDLANANQVISGGSGSGKSFLSNILMLHMLKEAPRIFIIDIGGSYKKLCEALSGQYVALAGGGEHSIDPFDYLGSKAGDTRTKLLVDLLDLMTREEGTGSLPKFERAIIEETIMMLQTSPGKPSMSKLRESLLASHEPTVAKLGRVISPWCGDTVYGRFVDRPTSIKLDSDIVCFDLKGMESYPDLQAVCLLLIMSFIWAEVERDRHIKKVVVFDECWKLLENRAGAAFIGEVFRTFRKYQASAVAISQNIDDFAKSSVADAILPNSSIKWILAQRGANRERLQTVLQLHSKEMELVDSLTQRKGVFSEAYLIAQDTRAVVSVESTPLEYWIATSDPRELAEIDRRAVNFLGSRLELLEQLANQFPKGLLAN